MRRFAPALTLVALGWMLPGAAPALAAARVIKGPYVTELTDTGAEIRFEVDPPGAAAVTLRPQDADAGAPRAIDAPGASALHVVRVSGLRPSTRYTYAVASGGRPAGEGTFVTAPRPGDPAPITFLAYGDDRSDPVAHAAIVKAMTAVPSDFLVHTGDMVESGSSDPDWQSFFDLEAPLLRTRPIFGAVGNHEVHGDADGSHFARFFGEPLEPGGPSRLYGTARVGALRLFWLDEPRAWDSGEERAWLEGALARADAEPGLIWRIVVAHHGPWSSGPHGPDERLVSAHVPELLAAHGVQLFLSGHDHLYERGEGGPIKYVVTGGAGAPLYRPREILPGSRKLEVAYHFVEIRLSGDELRLVAHRVDGTEIERCGFRVGQPWDCDRADAGAGASHAAGASRSVPLASPDASGPAPAPVAAAAMNASGSRCACDVPGRSAAAATPAACALGALMGASVAARRRSRRRRG